MIGVCSVEGADGHSSDLLTEKTPFLSLSQTCSDTSMLPRTPHLLPVIFIFHLHDGVHRDGRRACRDISIHKRRGEQAGGIRECMICTRLMISTSGLRSYSMMSTRHRPSCMLCVSSQTATKVEAKLQARHFRDPQRRQLGLTTVEQSILGPDDPAQREKGDARRPSHL